MPGYTTRILTIPVAGHDFRIRALSDLQQFADPTGRARRAGIHSSLWSLFGQVWPAGRVLAETMSTYQVAGKRILELGCGLGLSSLVLARRGADVVASDHHPLAESFLAYNAGLNDLPAIHYRDLPWELPDASLGRFDLIIGSDVLYERGHALQIATMMERHARPSAELLLTDPGRGNVGAFSRAMAAQGYAVDEEYGLFDDEGDAPGRGRLLHYARQAAGAAG
ncbi:class I SAM-dependent methyltransferase [Stenotrophomonas rhizophila]|uniref:class I SAM-dependent methyltransferase n=1 Tax=Stenotrophomonas rhizophila TaxID=216778 RepID=UPI001E4FF4E8|nr:protein N-lysine methyltransferase family protein [Stenotrophomonas rhizophila]MCC7634624.1 methyltransferase domain-containing protein [Stenotrophomonas rhizophila]MCC7664107.1 methyltransferase domain-containing protein [Stenotrophomonas rhizophila]